MANVLVFGHQNPDNDAIMSTVVLSQLLNQLEYQGNTYTACCLGPLPAESAKLLEDAGVPAPTLIDAIEPAAEGAEPQLVILTDHNEPGQSVAGLENATIFGVVDHHRFGDFTTAAPLHIVALPATDVDAAIAKKLGEQLGVDPVKFGMEVFLTRPSGSFTAAEMVGNDIKLFEVAGTKLLIGQYETVDKSRALGMILEIREAMRAYQADKAADGIVLCITDIMEEGSQVLLEGETVVAQKGLQIEDVAEGVWMPGVLSRKKQVAAPILAAN